MPKKNEYTISLKHDGPEAKETSDSIAEQVEQFLKSGGQIDQIPSGVSGQISLGEKARLAKEEQKQKQAERLAALEAGNLPAEATEEE
ncbi:hypothetical protein [Parendozoicomonas haliclonae]|uniref:Transcriptional regulator SutA RNAP-binding domain-containing protein n=1 Tax=Parendozoicomonas haliclonae TaxID=1960125 RepID=A0A1X7AN88_9GAMM|nr:hypothetical protein [Parendozoicomonas haliclonae]SMA49578.1 hypothetical protein EHSB41UT_03364 [Parendozoicomonas haliclonae]